MFIKLSVIGKIFCKCKGFEKSQFYKINKELRCCDLVLSKPSSFLISCRFATKRYLHGTYTTDKKLEESDSFADVEEDEDELEENELVLEDC